MRRPIVSGTKIAYDTKLCRPGCALIQAAMGCDPNIADNFDTRDWLLVPTDDMGVFPILSDDMLMALVRKTERNRKDKE
jgi:hypothetical protein